MPLQQTSGAASYDAFGGGAPVAAKYIEDFFQTWLRTGTGSSTTVTTGLNGAINETMVWTKSRSAATNHKLTDNVRGATKALSSNTTGAEVTDSQGLTAFSSTGYTIGTNTDYNNSGATYVDWQFVATPKFFDVVTYTGNSTAGRTISHNLGAVPGCIIVKCTSAGSTSWYVYHRSLGATKNLFLNTTAATQTETSIWNDTEPTSTVFTVGGNDNVNEAGQTFVAYLFAHNAGGFGLTGTDNVITCGSFTTDGSGNATVNLGFEPQWLLSKTTNVASSWDIVDVMRSWPVGPTNDAFLYPNNSNAEFSSATKGEPTSTGFNITAGGNTLTYIYIAIRRGPMRTPTSGTSVFTPVTYTGNGATTRVVNTTITPDAGWFFHRDTASGEFWFDRLRGGGRWLQPNSTGSESSWTGAWLFDVQNAVQMQSAGADYINGSGALNGLWALKRAPGFFDEVCWSSTGAAQSVSHNLGVVPELMIRKVRNGTWESWMVYAAPIGNNKILYLDQAAAQDVNNGWNNQTPTASQFFVNNTIGGYNFVTYLFASCPGVSKVGSYTGNGSTQTINCGFTGGARFVLIKRTDSTGDWYVYDTARGMTTLTDPYLLLNSTAAESATLGSVTTVTTGFALNAGILAAINTNAASYIFLAIA